MTLLNCIMADCQSHLKSVRGLKWFSRQIIRLNIWMPCCGLKSHKTIKRYPLNTRDPCARRNLRTAYQGLADFVFTLTGLIRKIRLGQFIQVRRHVSFVTDTLTRTNQIEATLSLKGG